MLVCRATFGTVGFAKRKKQWQNLTANPGGLERLTTERLPDEEISFVPNGSKRCVAKIFYDLRKSF
jgi:hypothetical protein